MDKVLVIVGPTGVGKTKLSISLATAFSTEIISGDSMQVYKEMSIGTAKIKEEEKQGIPHYLVDTYGFQEEYNVKIFQEKARYYMEQMITQKKLPILCGGTGLYIKSALYDYQFQEQEEDPAFVKFLQERSLDELWSLLKMIDPKVCEQLHQHNRQRIQRALSMAHQGVKKSDIIEAQEHKPIYDAYLIGLTMDRDRLYERINQRVDRMMEEGLLEEIQALVEKDANVWSLQSFQGIGYKEWKPYFEGQMNREECIEKIKKNSRNFAKRQYTWFKNQMNVHWYDIDQPDYEQDIQTDIVKWLGE